MSSIIGPEISQSLTIPSIFSRVLATLLWRCEDASKNELYKFGFFGLLSWSLARGPILRARLCLKHLVTIRPTQKLPIENFKPLQTDPTDLLTKIETRLSVDQSMRPQSPRATKSYPKLSSHSVLLSHSQLPEPPRVKSRSERAKQYQTDGQMDGQTDKLTI